MPIVSLLFVLLTSASYIFVTILAQILIDADTDVDRYVGVPFGDDVNTSKFFSNSKILRIFNLK